MEKNYCKCNCGTEIKPGRKFTHYHGRRIYPHVIKNSHPCACGCGELVDSDEQFVNAGHSVRGKPSWKDLLCNLLQDIPLEMRFIGRQEELRQAA